MEADGGAAPTGCYKCGRPGHWSRDCPSDPSTISNNEKSNNKPAASSHPFKASGGSSGASFTAQKQPIEKPKKAPKTRPKLTPELLLSDDGLGFVLRNFPKAFKYRGRGHEVEQIGGSKRVKLCINDLRERVANGGDPAKLPETLEPHEDPNHEQDAINLEEPSFEQEDTLPNHDTDDFQHDMLNEILENTTQEPSPPLTDEAAVSVPSQAADAAAIEMSEEVKARIEANRLKALEKAAARKRVLEPQPS